MGVGLTPYADTDFNRASFPLKTLEYLANGLPVVSTDLPAVRWLDTDLIEVGTGPEDFASKVREVLSRPFDEAERARRIAFARRHSWTARAEQLLAILPLAGGQRQ
jgi:teichuronic acid biosynthesis glycosyltransferase TuaH